VKKIIPLHNHHIYNFSEIKDYLLKSGLEPDQCLVVFQRHWPHENNITAEPYLEMGRQIGRITEKLFTLGAVISSPEPRAIEAAIAFQKGREKRLPIRTFDAIGSMSSEDPQLLSKLTADAKAADKSIEAEFLENPAYLEMRQRRGNDGAACVLANLSFGRALLVTSHGGSTLEPTIEALTGRGHYPHYMSTGDICLLLIQQNGDVLSERYLVFNGHNKKG